MKSMVLVLIIAVTVYAVDEPLKRHDKSGTERMLQDIAEQGEEMQQEWDEVDSDKGDVIEAFRALFSHRCKRNTVDQTENKRLIEIDALVEKLWADKDKRANDEAATDASVNEQKDEHSTEQGVKKPRKNVAHPRFENTPEYTHNRRKLERNKHERKNGKKDNRKIATVVQDEIHSDEHPIDAEKPTDNKPVIKKAGERKHHKIENQKKKITKHNENEESDEHPDSSESIPEDSPTAKSRKESALVEPVTVQSEPTTDAPEKSFTSDSASPATATDLVPVVFEDHSPVASADPTLVPTEDSAPVGSTDSATVAPEDSTTVASTGESDDAAHEEMTVIPSKTINLGQARLKRQDTTAESKKNKRTGQQVQRKSTAVLDRFAASAESAVPRKEKFLPTGNVRSGEVIRAKNPQTKLQSIYFLTASPKNIKTGTKKASAASARNGVPNKEQRPVEREAQASISTAKPAA